MYTYGIVPAAAKLGPYENLVEETLKSVGIKKTGGVHRVACLMLGNIKSQMVQKGVYGKAVTQPEIQRGVSESVRFDGRSPIERRKMLQYILS